MFRSIADDVKSTFQYGNMINRLIIINASIFLILLVLSIFMNVGGTQSPLYSAIIKNLAIPSSLGTLLVKPWTLFTYMFLHEGFWHLIWNMLIFFWFGRIVGDFIGDSKIIPIYILGGLMGALFYLISVQIGLVSNGYMMGASAAVMAMVTTAAVLSPDYSMRLFIIGDVKIKWIALFLIIMDLVSINNQNNAGGHIAHLGGVSFGFLYVTLTRQGTDLATSFNNAIDAVRDAFSKKEKKRKSPLTVKHKAKNIIPVKGKQASDSAEPFQEKLDKILDKIKADGYDKLTDEEKEFLFLASKK